MKAIDISHLRTSEEPTDQEAADWDYAGLELVWHRPDGKVERSRCGITNVWSFDGDAYSHASQRFDDWYEFDDPTANGCWYETNVGKAQRGRIEVHPMTEQQQREAENAVAKMSDERVLEFANSGGRLAEIAQREYQNREEMKSEASAWWLRQDVSPDGTQAISYSGNQPYDGGDEDDPHYSLERFER